MEDFKTGRRPILVATAVAARGLDIPNVMHVVKYVMGLSFNSYIRLDVLFHEFTFTPMNVGCGCKMLIG